MVAPKARPARHNDLRLSCRAGPRQRFGESSTTWLTSWRGRSAPGAGYAAPFCRFANGGSALPPGGARLGFARLRVLPLGMPWHREWALSAVCCVAVTASGCEGDAGPDGKCDSNVVALTNRLQCLVDGLTSDVGDYRTVVAQSCAAIVVDMGQTAPTLSDPPSDEELSNACSLATAAINAAVQQAACPTMTVSGGDCSPDASAQAACQQACAGDTVCLTCCDLMAPFEDVCTPPTLAVAASNPALQMTLLENLPALLLAPQRAAHWVDWAELAAMEFESVSEAANESGGCQSTVDEMIAPLAIRLGLTNASISTIFEVVADVDAAANCGGSTP